MSKLRELFRLKFACELSNRQTARALKMAASTVGCYFKAAQAAKLNWDIIEPLDDVSLINQLEPFCKQLTATTSEKTAIDLTWVHQQLKQKGVTRELLWEEYKQSADKPPYSYTEFCRQYRAYRKTLKPSMRQVHVAGEKAFVDYAGPTIPIINSATGEVSEAKIFVGVLGASNYTFAEATLSRSLPDWIGSHVRMFEFFGGVPALVVPDNEKAGVNKACYYDPELNPQYAALACHYQTTILPTRPRKPRDKAKVENAVLVVERWILARLRHYQFFSLQELNAAIQRLLIELNQRAFKKLPGSRQSQFEMLDKPVLKPLPTHAYEYADIKKVQVRLDYHVEIQGHYYSVPHQLLNKIIQYRCGQKTVELFYQGSRVASHMRDNRPGKSTTVTEHMPKVHQQHQQWSPQQFLDWAKQIGQATLSVAEQMVTSQPHPEWCYRKHLGLMNLAKRYTKPRLESACQYAMEYALPTYDSIASILTTQIDQAPLQAMNDDQYQPQHHDHVRGANYYSS